MLWWLLALSLLLAGLARRKVGRRAPIVFALIAWAATFATAIAAQLGVPEPNARSAAILAVGLVSLALPSFLIRRPAVERQDRSERPPVMRLVVAAGLLLVMVAIGIVKFRSAIASTYGTGFGTLTETQIRAAQTGTARGGGLTALFLTATPLLACVGIYGYVRYSRAWASVVAVAVAAAAYTPARLPVITLGITAAYFYLYCRDAYGKPPVRRRLSARQAWVRYGRRAHEVAHRMPRPRGQFALMLFTGAMLVWYFIQSGDSTGKNDLTLRAYPTWGGPGWAITPVLYLTGGVAALSKAIELGANPFDHGNSLFSLYRAWHVLDPRSRVPNSLAQPVRIPSGFNVYTGFGQVYFDFGFAGVVVLSGLLGWLSARAHRRAASGRLVSMWVAATLLSLLLTMQQAYRLFFLDVDFQLILGSALFWWLDLPVPKRRVSKRRPVPAKGKHPPPPVRPLEELSPAWQRAFGLTDRRTSPS